jgi:YHS domain-containing protein
MSVDAKDKPFHATYEGREYVFCSQRCRDAFLENPVLYARRTA